MCSRNLVKILLVTGIFFLIGQVGSSPIADLPDLESDESNRETSEELDDLNESGNMFIDDPTNQTLKRSSEEVSSFPHRDEEQTPTPTPELDRYKYDVEVLEARDSPKDNDDLEERFRGGPAIQMNTYTFGDEEIEVSLIGQESLQPDHTTLAIVLVVVAVFLICLYGGMVMWRAHLDQRYGMRELLVADDEDFVRNRNKNNNKTIYSPISGSRGQH